MCAFSRLELRLMVKRCDVLIELTPTEDWKGSVRKVLWFPVSGWESLSEALPPHSCLEFYISKLFFLVPKPPLGNAPQKLQLPHLAD
jgi:hypothetical protein